MTREFSWGKGRLRALCGPALLTLALFVAPASPGKAQSLSTGYGAAPAVGAAYKVGQQGPRLHVPAPQHVRPVNERRRRQRRPLDAFRGLMTPGSGAGGECRRPRQVRRRLQRQGWWDFHGLRRVGDNFAVRARRPNGTVYQLRIERCSGRVLKARPLDGDGGHRLWAR